MRSIEREIVSQIVINIEENGSRKFNANIMHIDAAFNILSFKSDLVKYVT